MLFNENAKKNQKLVYKIENATKNKFRELLIEKPKIIHIICHGEFDKAS